jgi:hypothetical protein
MTAPELATHERYLAEANAELDAMLGEVGEVDSAAAPPQVPARSWVHLLVVGAIALAVLAVGVLLLRGRRQNRVALHILR